MKISEKLQERTYLFTLLLFSLVTHWYLLFDTKLLNSGDWVYKAPSLLKTFLGTGLWNQYTSLGAVNGFPSNLIFYWSASVLNRISDIFSWDIFTRIFFLVPIIFFTPLFSFIFLRKITKNNFIAFSGTCIYSFNTFFLKLQLDWITYAWIWWVLPALLMTVWNYLQTQKSRYLVYIVILIFLAITFEVRIALVVLLLTSIGVITHFVIIGRHTNAWIKTYIMLFLALIFGLTTHIFWIYPLLKGLSGDVLSQASPTPFASFFDLNDVMTLHSYQWSKNLVFEPFIKQSVPIQLFLIPVLVFYGLLKGNVYIKRVKKERLFWWSFFSITIVAFGFLAKQSFPPFINFYDWAFHNIPLFNLFRESSKFLILVALSIAYFFAHGLQSVKELLITKNKYVAYVIVFVVLGLTSFINLQNFVTQDVGGMTKGVTMPKEYRELESELSKDDNFYRTLWVPSRPRFGFQSNMHPSIDMTELVNTLKDRLGFVPFNQQIPTSEQLTYLLNQPYSRQLLNEMNIKYIIIPDETLRTRRTDNVISETVPEIFEHYGDRKIYLDQLNKVDYVKPTNIGNSSLAVYENNNQFFYYDSFTKLATFGSESNLATKITNSNNLLGAVNYTTENNSYSSDFLDVLDNLTTKNLYNNSLNRQSLSSNKLNSLYVNTSASNVSLNVSNNILKLVTSSISKLEISTVVEESVDKSLSYYIEADNKVYNVDTKNDNEHSLGRVSNVVRVVSTIRQNLLENSDFKSDFWARSVSDCHPYDLNPDIGIKTEQKDGTNILVLRSGHHTACTSPKKIMVNGGGTYLLNFKYMASDFSGSAYSIEFDDKTNTKITENLLRHDDNLREYNKLVDVPVGATSMKLVLYAYDRPSLLSDSGGRTDVFTKFADFFVSPVRIVGKYSTPLPRYESQSISNQGFSYISTEYKYENIINNPSFEKGLWREKVGDCHAYDENPKLGMRISNESSSGQKSLQLEASRHIACTTTDLIDVKESSKYLFSFDFQSPNAQVAKYYISFNDKSKTTLTEDLNIKTTSWQTYSKQIKVPYGATNMTLAVYAQSEEPEAKNIINRYDNFSMIRIPDLENVYYLTGNNEASISKPKDITYKFNSPTKKTIHVKGAKTSFYLSMSEAYHEQWKLEFNNTKLNGLGGLLPTKHPDSIPDSYHFKLNDYLNGWYIDVPKYCGEQKLCKQNADGSYDIEFVAEFAPQRWFYVGLIISGTTLLGCFIYLAFDYKKRHGKGIYYAIPGAGHAATLGKGLIFYGKSGYKKSADSNWLHRDDDRKSKVKGRK